MKTIKLITILLFCFSIGTVAQPGSRFKEKKEQIKSLKVAFITNELNLTPDEAAKFWPIFNAFDAKQTELRQEKIKNY